MNFTDLWKAILGGMKGPLQAGWSSIRSFAEAESKKIAHSLITIAKLAALPQGNPERITKEQARLLLDIQLSASRGILLTSEAIGLIAAQKALQAGLDAVSKTVNTAAGFALI